MRPSRIAVHPRLEAHPVVQEQMISASPLITSCHRNFPAARGPMCRGRELTTACDNGSSQASPQFLPLKSFYHFERRMSNRLSKPLENAPSMRRSTQHPSPHGKRNRVFGCPTRKLWHSCPAPNAHRTRNSRIQANRFAPVARVAEWQTLGT